MSINGWDIQVAVVNGILGAAGGSTEDLRAEETALQDAVSGAAESVNSPVIQQALTACYEEYLSRLLSSGVIQAENACKYTGEAVQHYISGDADMADAAARNAGNMPEDAGALK
ncbi:DUF6507 family protein [Arthrobacter sp. zg-Y179]|uniref:DUF6507 family protein n=1 Tax=Arthrobacter sp. zg-Y179 TaxID=2894188 RepID=UPI001E4793E7|nr:DUF6507 family protein [Arthrobacter sp. zg-Y179]MCC9175569.1 DUF6507 family protein [Arthrobacter sp. zg-Y179]